MPENPLLPNARLKELYATMQQTRALALRERPRPALRLEALLAATLLQVEPGDFVSNFPHNLAADTLSALRIRQPRSKRHPASPAPTTQRLTIAAGVALAQKLAAAEKSALTLAFTATGRNADPGWADALRYAATAELPFLLACTAPDTPPRASTAASLTLPTILRVARPLHLPVITVDGTDAVAVYRVMQESVLRARMGGGPAVLWCIFPNPAPDPLRHMRRYLADRNLLPK